MKKVKVSIERQIKSALDDKIFQINLLQALKKASLVRENIEFDEKRNEEIWHCLDIDSCVIDIVRKRQHLDDFTSLMRIERQDYHQLFKDLWVV